MVNTPSSSVASWRSKKDIHQNPKACATFAFVRFLCFHFALIFFSEKKLLITAAFFHPSLALQQLVSSLTEANITIIFNITPHIFNSNCNNQVTIIIQLLLHQEYQFVFIKLIFSLHNNLKGFFQSIFQNFCFLLSSLFDRFITCLVNITGLSIPVRFSQYDLPLYQNYE